MSADSPKHQGPKIVKDDSHIVLPQVVTDPSLYDSVAGFISDVVPSSYSAVVDKGDQIEWVRFEQGEFEELSYDSCDDHEKSASSPPIFLVIGYTKGAQVWCISATGEATEILSWKHVSIKVMRILPSPYMIGGDATDLFKDKRPLIALCDYASLAPVHFNLSFISLKTGEQVHSIKFKHQIIDVFCNKISIIVTFVEKITVLDAFTLRERCTITTCYSSPGPNVNPIALGPRWLAFAERTLSTCRKSFGGCENEGVQSYKATVIHSAKTFTKVIKDLSETVANSFTGSSNFKPSVVCPGSPQSGGVNDCFDKGTVTVVDLKSDKIEGVEGSLPSEAIVAHFMAHSDCIVQLEFDNSGMLLLTADLKGYDFHVFRIHPHPLGSHLGSVHHLYTLHRGDTSARIQSMSFSSDSRWVAVTSSRGTTHVFPITPYGGNINNRTHTNRHVVNKMSRYHRSAGLSNDERPRSPVPGTESLGAKIYPYTNPRHPPFPNPIVVNPLAQIRQPSTQIPGATVHSRSTITRQRSYSYSEDVIFLKVVTCFAGSRAYMDIPVPSDENDTKFMEHLFLMNSNGTLFQYDLEPVPSQSVSFNLVCDDTPIELKAIPRAQWYLQRRQNAEDVQLPLAEKYLEYFVPCESLRKSHSIQDDSKWCSQVEIITHASPHRRLWMGPQFVFKTYTITPGFPFVLQNIQNIDIARSKIVNMPAFANEVLIECNTTSGDSSPSSEQQNVKVLEANKDMEEMNLKNALAEAMNETADVKELGGHRVIVSMKPQATPVAKVVNPLGTVVTIHSDAETEKEQFEESIIHENCDETLFRPIIVSKPIVHTDGKPHTNPTDTMLVRSLDDSTEVAVKLLDKSKNTHCNNLMTNKKPKHIIEKPMNFSTEYNSNKSTTEKKEIRKNKEEKSEINKEIAKTPFDISDQFDSISLGVNKYSGSPEPSDDMECALVFGEDKDFKNEFDYPFLEIKNEDKEAKTDMFEDATDCYDDLYINIKKDITDKNEENMTEEKIAPSKPRKPKTKLGVRIPNKHFPIKNEEDVESLIPKRSWSSVAATKPKEKVLDISEKENCDLLDFSDEKGDAQPPHVEFERQVSSSSGSNASRASVNSDGLVDVAKEIAML
ncbi:breast carcinoma-amplified sequence 3 homolog isoform X2 [Harmonia axyridis]|uniref:breast carcinoma-amplified sequence 3 homolog isoform X2 n=1 Tax=Harmonia axyridis TaxID=115357 RepID=UPI001E278591|nr:breast carcinoma-amplified sequence 3 homolog isoform X2 [Harmonia axyridis]